MLNWIHFGQYWILNIIFVYFMIYMLPKVFEEGIVVAGLLKEE